MRTGLLDCSAVSLGEGFLTEGVHLTLLNKALMFLSNTGNHTSSDAVAHIEDPSPYTIFVTHF